jgi:hypothetical protein
MIAVAVAAVICSAYVRYPGVAYLGLCLGGPLVGALLGARLSKEPSSGSILGGIAAGFAEAVILGSYPLWADKPAPFFLWVLLGSFIIVVVGTFGAAVGAIVGFFVALVLLDRSDVRPHRSVINERAAPPVSSGAGLSSSTKVL